MGRTVIPMPEYVEKETLLRQAIEERRFVLRLEQVVDGDSVVFRTVYKDLADFIRNAPAAEAWSPWYVANPASTPDGRRGTRPITVSAAGTCIGFGSGTSAPTGDGGR